MTVLDLVILALKDLGVLAPGQVPTSAEGQDALDKLNAMIDAWKAERVFIYDPNVRTTFVIDPTSVTNGTYTVGTGGGVNVARPVHINGVSILDTSVTPNLEHGPLRLLTDAGWRNVSAKTLTSFWPTDAYYNPTYGATGFATLELWPRPESTTITGVFYAPGAISEFAALSTTVSLPPGYRRAIVTNLALELAPSNSVTPSDDLQKQARESLMVVQRSNKRLEEMSFDPGAGVSRRGGYYDIYTD